MANTEHKGGPPGPEPERLKLDGDWEDRVDEALGKKKPKKGWLKPADAQNDGDAEKTPPSEEGGA